MKPTFIIIIFLIGVTIPDRTIGAVHCSMAAPLIYTIDPPSTSASAKAFTVSILGANFTKDIKVFFGAIELSKVRLFGDSLIKAEIPAVLNQVTSTFISITTPDFLSTSHTFVITSKPYLQPVITTVIPETNTQREWASFELTIKGSLFDTTNAQVLLSSTMTKLPLAVKTITPNTIVVIVPNSVVSGQYNLVVENPHGAIAEMRYGILECYGSLNPKPPNFLYDPASIPPIIRQVIPAAHTQYEQTAFTLTIVGLAFWCRGYVQVFNANSVPIRVPSIQKSHDTVVVMFPPTFKKGDYQIQVVNQFAAEMSTSFPYSLLPAPVAIKAFNDTPLTLQVYPQPASSDLWMRIPSQHPGMVSIALCSITGTIIYSSTQYLVAGDNLEHINTSKFSAGTYFLSLNDGFSRVVLPVALYQ